MKVISYVRNFIFHLWWNLFLQHQWYILTRSQHAVLKIWYLLHISLQNMLNWHICQITKCQNDSRLDEVPAIFALGENHHTDSYLVSTFPLSPNHTTIPNCLSRGANFSNFLLGNELHIGKPNYLMRNILKRYYSSLHLAVHWSFALLDSVAAQSQKVDWIYCYKIELY